MLNCQVLAHVRAKFAVGQVSRPDILFAIRVRGHGKRWASRGFDRYSLTSRH
jgi:hypothetical protein